MRLVKFLSHAGVASRRASEALIAEGRVALGGEVVTDPAIPVAEDADVTVDGRPVRTEATEVWLLNKPAGVVSTARDPGGRPKVTDLVDSAARLYPVGRLDVDTTGLILLTNDGELANRLTHPRYGVEKTYRVLLAGAIDGAATKRLREGVRLDGGRSAPARVRVREPKLIELTIAEGRKRQVRRMAEAVGNRVVRLKRVRMGPLRLGNLPEGRARRLSRAEVERLRQGVGL